MLAAGAPVGDYRLPVSSVQDQRFAGVLRQKYDFSCGSAALATLLRFHYGYDVAEEKAFRGMWASGDRDQIRAVGFSLLDMKRWLASRGIAADGYRVPLEKVAETRIPGIALISLDNYRHFVVVKGIRDGEVLIGDPSAGLTVMPQDEFADAWNGIYFVLAADQELARSNFGSEQQWARFARAPVGGGFSDPLSQQALLLTAPFYGDIS
ncbi:C39 family peptidase [Croceicoccus sp. F390]|uniref:C39 family peptidase n=1 Tax=Croceicoccus esteveae TaxID=3075597 RepID=A0ABU2ZG91_9SPHN|nr:C39 family peptidase [Croceicoccus sp. F390]MDT0575622.1 C39 family peptidase [Croceicoccus sp. F390]